MNWHTLRNMLLLTVLLTATGWWVYAGAPSEAPKPAAGSAEAPLASETHTAATQGESSTAPDASSPAQSTSAMQADEATAEASTAAADDTTTPQSSTGDNSTSQPSAVAAPTPGPAPRAAAPKRGISDVLEGVDYSIPGERERVVAELKAIEEADKMAAIARAQELGLPVRREMPDGRNGPQKLQKHHTNRSQKWDRKKLKTGTSRVTHSYSLRSRKWHLQHSFQGS
jgi:cytoskeletal protein RodZ